MQEHKVMMSLCVRDQRHPTFDEFDWDESEVFNIRTQCWCDNCCTGKKELAEEIIRLRELLKKESN